jgi:hypothetical protein
MKAFSSLVLLTALISTAVPTLAGSEGQNERIGAAFALALGRAPAAEEIELWSKQGKLPVADLVARLQAQGDSAVDRAFSLRLAYG